MSRPRRLPKTIYGVECLTCSGCEQWIAVAEFRRVKDVPRSRCKSCERAQRRSYSMSTRPRGGQRDQTVRASALRIEARGKTLTIARWAIESDISEWTIRARIEAGWPPAKAVTVKPQRGRVRELREAQS